MKCPSCGQQALAKETRAIEGGALRRRRWCGCGFRFTTVEAIYAPTRAPARPPRPAQPPRARKTTATVAWPAGPATWLSGLTPGTE